MTIIIMVLYGYIQKKNNDWVEGDKLFSILANKNPVKDEVNKIDNKLYFGKSVYMSSDGGTIIVGCENFSSIFTKSPDNKWVNSVSKLVSTSVDSTSLQGDTTIISNDGTQLIISAPGNNKDIGGVITFTKVGSNWTENKVLSSDDIIGSANQGWATVLSGDGTTLAISSYKDNYNMGCVWVYKYSELKKWSLQDKLIPTDNIKSSYFGYSLSLTNDGNMLAIGGIGDNDGTGATWIWTRDNNNKWNYNAKLIGNGSIGKSQQGFSVSLSGSGNTLAVGGPLDNKSIGATWIFSKVENDWIQTGKLVGLKNIGVANQGCSVSLSFNGTILAVGGDNDNNRIGATWVFVKSKNNWYQHAKLVGSKTIGFEIFQGFSCSLSDKGDVLAIGGYGDNNNIGATWIFGRTKAGWVEKTKIVGSNYIGSSNQGKSVALSGDGTSVVIGGYNDYNGIGSVWIYENLETVWKQVNTKLIPTNYIGKPNIGKVAVSNDGTILAVGGIKDNYGIGAVWTFQWQYDDSLILFNSEEKEKMKKERDLLMKAGKESESESIKYYQDLKKREADEKKLAEENEKKRIIIEEEQAKLVLSPEFNGWKKVISFTNSDNKKQNVDPNEINNKLFLNKDVNKWKIYVYNLDKKEVEEDIESNVEIIKTLYNPNVNFRGNTSTQNINIIKKTNWGTSLYLTNNSTDACNQNTNSTLTIGSQNNNTAIILPYNNGPNQYKISCGGASLPNRVISIYTQ